MADLFSLRAVACSSMRLTVFSSNRSLIEDGFSLHFQLPPFLFNMHLCNWIELSCTGVVAAIGCNTNWVVPQDCSQLPASAVASVSTIYSALVHPHSYCIHTHTLCNGGIGEHFTKKRCGVVSTSYRQIVLCNKICKPSCGPYNRSFLTSCKKSAAYETGYCQLLSIYASQFHCGFLCISNPTVGNNEVTSGHIAVCVAFA